MKRIPQLDSVRAIAFLTVFLGHSLSIGLMWGGVDLFFILSGFLITGVLLDIRHRPLGDYFAHFYGRRARRILPAYLLFLVVIALCYGVWWLRHWYFYILLTNLLYALKIPYPHPLGVLWSLAVEEQFYLAWPFAVYFLNRRHLRWLCIALMVAAPLIRATFLFTDRGIPYELTPFRMDLLAAGGLLALQWRDHRPRIEDKGGKLGLSLIACACVAFTVLRLLHITLSSNTRLSNALVYEASLLLWLGFMVYALGNWHIGWLRTAPLRYLGKISYSMYLIHLGIITLLIHYRHLTGPRLALPALVLTIIYATLSWYLLEERFLRGSHEVRPNVLVPSHQVPRAT